MQIKRREWLELGGLASAASVFGAPLAAACAPQGTPRAMGDQLFVATKRGLAAIDPASGARRFVLPDAVPSMDWTRLFVSAASDGSTRLTTVDAKSGAQVAAVELEGQLAAKVASKDRSRLALLPAELSGGNPWQPALRTHTTLVVADPTGTQAPRRLDLEGNYAPDAFSTDNTHLFVLEYLPAENPDRYRVRQLDLKTGKPGPLLTRFKLAPVAAEEEMKGQGRMQVAAPSGQTIYTLYTHQEDHLHSRDYVQAGGSGAPNPMVHAFVHTLSLTEGWAYCLDLPMPFGTGPAWAHAITVSYDGFRLFVADRSSGTLAAADTQSLQVKGIYQVEMGPIDEPGEMAIEAGPDGTLYLASGSAVLVFNAAALGSARAPQKRWPVGGTICGLKLSHDAQRLYVGLANRVGILRTSDGGQIGQITVPEVESIPHVARVS